MKPKHESHIWLCAPTIECCHYCVAPKRYPGCHGKCQEYLEEKAEYEKRKRAYYGDPNVNQGLYGQRAARVEKALKGKWKR